MGDDDRKYVRRRGIWEPRYGVDALRAIVEEERAGALERVYMGADIGAIFAACGVSESLLSGTWKLRKNMSDVLEPLGLTYETGLIPHISKENREECTFEHIIGAKTEAAAPIERTLIRNFVRHLPAGTYRSVCTAG